MASRFAASFDALLDNGRRQLDELAGRPAAPPSEVNPADQTSLGKASRPSDGSIEGTASGIAFRLKPKP